MKRPFIALLLGVLVLVGGVLAVRMAAAPRQPFADVVLYVGASKGPLVDRLGKPVDRQTSTSARTETLLYRSGQYELRLQFQGDRLTSWSEVGPYQRRPDVEQPPQTGGCCD